MNDYKSLQIEFEKFKKYHHEEHMKLQTELSYLKDLFRKMNKGKIDLSHLLSVLKHTIVKMILGSNTQTTFSKKTKSASSKKVNLKKVSQKKNIVHSNPKAKTCHYCMKRGQTSYKCYVLGLLASVPIVIVGFTFIKEFVSTGT